MTVVRRGALLTRAVLGTVDLAAAPLVAALENGEAGPLTVPVYRVLGVRQLLQAAVVRPSSPAALRTAGTIVDALHAASMVALALRSRHYRSGAIVQAAIATGFVLSSLSLRTRLVGGRPW